MNNKTENQNFIITEQVTLFFECKANNEKEARKLYENYISTQEGRLELIETAIQTTCGPVLNIEKVS